MNTESLKTTLSSLSDPRRPYGNLRHKLIDIIILGLCTVICGGEDFNDMETFGLEREDWLKTFLDLPNGIPDSDTFRRVFESVDPQELSNCLNSWLEIEGEARSVVAIDGKTIRGSGNSKHKAYHVVSAFVAENQLTLGQISVDEKTNEITAVPELLDIIDVENSIVTADAMSCQKEITKKITEKKADYAIALKENQPALYEDSRLYFRDFKQDCLKYETNEAGHGRIEKRTYYLVTEPQNCWEYDWPAWENLRGIGMVHSKVEENGRIREENRYYITSLTSVEDFAYAVRKHWSIENQLHWCLDVIFREDAARARKDNSPLNMNIVRKLALTLLNGVKYGRLSKKKKMFKAALNPQVLLEILFQSE